ncbi:allophanate hydrolase, partial [Pseudomonas syringae]
LLALSATVDPRDAYSRRNPLWNDASAFGAPRPFRFGVPRAEDLQFFGCTEGPRLFNAAIDHLTALGGEAVTVDLSPFLEAARLLYAGPWVAERYSVAGQLMEEHPDAVVPVLRDVLAQAPQVRGVDTFRAHYRLPALKAARERALGGLASAVTPSIGRPA